MRMDTAAQIAVRNGQLHANEILKRRKHAQRKGTQSLRRMGIARGAAHDPARAS